MSGIDKAVAEKIATWVPKIAEDVAKGLTEGHRKIADHITRAADRIDEDEKRLAAEAKSLSTKTHGVIKEGESVRYKEGTIRGRGVKGDQLTPDHIPSVAALFQAKQESIWAAEAKRLGRPLYEEEIAALRLTKAHKAAIRDDAWALVKEEGFHGESRTFRGRNTTEQIALDAKDLAVAVEKDFTNDLSKLEKSGELTKQRCAEYFKHHENLVSDHVIDYSEQIQQVLLAFLKKAK